MTTTDATALNDTTAEPITPETDIEGDAETTPSRGHHEAAKYRRQLRDVEAERDALAARAEDAQRRFVDHIAMSVGKVKPAALWASGVDLAAMLDDDGNVDPAKVEQACAAAVETFGLQRTPRPDPSIGRGFATEGNSSFAAAFRRR